ncbi:hypothetical protein SV7mr_20680 [Stieleria bergensis]|uniref:Uncharacterized protein n=1 Tax=Stieleria bergensis TaxID=2528025 RepID=A0A517STY0_9BACT|nr:hypothetical protein SV7mr_20680 [Planctomycetes bacterium SV_7m_r]
MISSNALNIALLLFGDNGQELPAPAWRSTSQRLSSSFPTRSINVLIYTR